MKKKIKYQMLPRKMLLKVSTHMLEIKTEYIKIKINTQKPSQMLIYRFLLHKMVIVQMIILTKLHL